MRGGKTNEYREQDKRLISLRRLAKEAYISNVTIYNYANDRSCPSAEVLHDIAKYFGVTMESFWDA